jgi:ketosteroid isomerase-like protein
MKSKLFSIVLSSMILVSCNYITQEKSNLKIIETYFEHFNRHEWQQMAALYADSVQMRDPSFGSKIVVQSRAEIETKYAQLAQIIPDVQDSIVNIYPSQQHYIVEFISTGTAPDGKKFELPICTIFSVVKGKITRDYTYYDETGN